MKLQRIRKSQRLRGLKLTQKVIKPKPLPAEEKELTPKERLLLRGIYATDLEARVFLWLERQDYKEGVDFSFQSSVFGGRQEAGGQVADFILYTGYSHPLVIRVMGQYWHEKPAQEQKDDAARSILESYGFIVVDVWETDIMEALNRVMEQALRGISLR